MVKNLIIEPPHLSTLKNTDPCPTCGNNLNKAHDEYSPSSPERIIQQQCEALIDQTIRPYRLRHASFRALTWSPATSTALSYIAPFLGCSGWLVAIGPWGLVGIGAAVFLGVLGHGLIQHFMMVVPATKKHATSIAQHKQRLEKMQDMTIDLKKRLQDLNHIEKIINHDMHYFFIELLLAGPLASLQQFYQILQLIFDKLQKIFWQLVEACSNSAQQLAHPIRQVRQA